ncbi:peptidoglycan-binding domain-containing protein [Catenulispora subtropica]|uniref:Peptidoglycan binding-like domain-containing protein n=1 Tax=Catenulispora subtropica TaxID=450798 RepID=A0ABN2R1B8_9ACTN
MHKRLAAAASAVAVSASLLFMLAVVPAQAAATSANPCGHAELIGEYCGYYAGSDTIAEWSGNTAAVMEIQDLINRDTDYPNWLSVDGSFGSKTFTAVEWLQSHHHLCGGVDGIVGSCTWSYLRGYTN